MDLWLSKRILLPSLQLTWHLKIFLWKMRFLLETTIFRGHVSFRECNQPVKWKVTNLCRRLVTKSFHLTRSVMRILTNLRAFTIFWRIPRKSKTHSQRMAWNGWSIPDPTNGQSRARSEWTEYAQLPDPSCSQKSEGSTPKVFPKKIFPKKCWNVSKHKKDVYVFFKYDVVISCFGKKCGENGVSHQFQISSPGVIPGISEPTNLVGPSQRRSCSYRRRSEKAVKKGRKAKTLLLLGVSSGAFSMFHWRVGAVWVIFCWSLLIWGF